MKPLALLASLAILPLHCSSGLGQTVDDANLVVTTHASGFSLPTGLKFLGNSPGDFFVIEKDTGRVQRRNGATTTTALDLAVANDSERGLLGIEVDPSFATNNFVYLYYSATSGADGGAWTENRLSRFTWNGTALGGETILRTFGTSSDGLANGPNHDAGPILFGRDGMLYGTTGDLNRDRAEQNNQGQAANSALVGGLYRLNTDGTVPADNPFTSHANSNFHPWYAYGVRNTFGIAFDPVTGNLWDTENGPGDYDEVNLALRGFNSGWNEIMGPDVRDPQGTGDLVNLPNSAYSDPEFSWLSTVAPTGLVFLADSLMDADYRDALLVGDANLGNISLFRLNATRDGFVLAGGLADLVADTGAERDAVVFGQGFNAVTEMLRGPDGAIYITSLGSGNIYRLAPIPEPASVSLLVIGAGMLCLLTRRRSALRHRR
jgi:glucose/arabinose dehydrogenase